MKINLGILSPSNIAFKRFLPGISHNKKYNFIGVAIPSQKEYVSHKNTNKYNKEVLLEHAMEIRENYGGKIFNSFDDMLSSNEIEAVYIPLPPHLHYHWAKKALEFNKHVLLEKPFTLDFNHTKELVKLAEKKNLAIHENYAYLYHNIIRLIMDDTILEKIGEIKFINTVFTFPFRGPKDFRYTKLNHGAMGDCAGYPISLIQRLTNQLEIIGGILKETKNLGVNTYGSIMFADAKGIISVAQFGMDNFYQNYLEILGTNGRIYVDRIFTPPIDYKLKIEINHNIKETIICEVSDQFEQSADHFHRCVVDNNIRQMNNDDIMKRNELIDQIEKRGFYEN